jgi:hypothetical protein
MNAPRLAALWLAAGLAAAAAAETAGSLRPWTNYQVIMWVGDSIHQQKHQWSRFQQRLREMGVTAGMVYDGGDPRPWVASQFPYYVENIINRGLCLKFHSNVTDWDKFVTRWKDTRDEASLVRDYCLDDPQWRAWGRAEMQKVARGNRDYSPLLYDIRDELSVTISANPFDYDFNPIALTAFREWLATQYPSLAALNAQWETQFKAWDEIKPFTTDQIKNRMASGEALPRGRPDWQALQRLRFHPRTAREQPTRWNFSPWADHRTYMDVSLARALDDFRQAARVVDPHTPVGIEGTQMPHAFGGYDLWRLAGVLDWVEPYDIGNAREIFGSFMPGKIFLTTVFEKETRAASRRLWHLLLQGDRGCIIWWSEDCLDWKNAELPLTAKARALEPVLREMTSPLARVFMLATKDYDPIALHYSQPSIQVAWLLESTVDGSTWLRRFSSYEASHNHQAKVRNSWLKIFQDLGYTPRFISQAQMEQGELEKSGIRVLVLPSSWAMSDRERDAISAAQRRAQSPLVVYGNDLPGIFDAHARLRTNWSARFYQDNHLPPAVALPAAFAQLDATQGPPQSRSGDVGAYARDRLKPVPDLSWAQWVATHRLPLTPPVTVPLEARVRVHRFRLGNARLLALERGIDYHMSEDLKQAGGNEALEQPADITAVLAEAAHVYDLRAARYLGRLREIKCRLDPWRPSLFALLPEPVPEEQVLQTLLAQTPAPR